MSCWYSLHNVGDIDDIARDPQAVGARRLVVVFAVDCLFTTAAKLKDDAQTLRPPTTIPSMDEICRRETRSLVS